MKVLEADLEDLGLNLQVYLACLPLLEPAYKDIILSLGMSYFRGSSLGAC